MKYQLAFGQTALRCYRDGLVASQEKGKEKWCLEGVMGGGREVPPTLLLKPSPKGPPPPTHPASLTLTFQLSPSPTFLDVQFLQG